MQDVPDTLFQSGNSGIYVNIGLNGSTASRHADRGGQERIYHRQESGTAA